MGDVAIVGLIPDTHGLLRQEALTGLKGSDLIIHGGDIGKPGIIERLRAVAPVVAVRGNIDKGAWASQLPMTEMATAPEFSYVVEFSPAELKTDGDFILSKFVCRT